MAKPKVMTELGSRDYGSYDDWRLRTLSEQRTDNADAQLEEHITALRTLQRRLAKGDVKDVVIGLRQVQERLEKTATSLE